MIHVVTLIVGVAGTHYSTNITDDDFHHNKLNNDIIEHTLPHKNARQYGQNHRGPRVRFRVGLGLNLGQDE